MGAATVTSNGQVTIPAEMRHAFDIQAGASVTFFVSLNGELKVRVGKPRAGAGRGSIDGGTPPTREDVGQAIADGVFERLERAVSKSDRTH